MGSIVLRSTATYRDDVDRRIETKRAMQVKSFVSTEQLDVVEWEQGLRRSENVREASHLLFGSDEKYPLFGVTFKRETITIEVEPDADTRKGGSC